MGQINEPSLFLRSVCSHKYDVIIPAPRMHDPETGTLQSVFIGNISIRFGLSNYSDEETGGVHGLGGLLVLSVA